MSNTIYIPEVDASIIDMGGTVSGGTVGSVLFVGAGGTLAQDNANFFWDDTNNMHGIGTAAPGAHLEIDSLATGNKGIIVKGIAGQTATLQEWQNSAGTPYLTVGPPTLAANSSTSNWLYGVGTFPSGRTQPSFGVQFDFTGSSSNPVDITAMRVALEAGYTGSAQSRGAIFENYSAGTGTSLASGNANYSFYAYTSSTTTGTNVGCLGVAIGGNINTGLLSLAVTAKNSATNIGCLGAALNTGSSPIQVGGYFTLNNMSSTPTFVSAALMADNAATTSDIFVARDNGTSVFKIADGGLVTQATWQQAPSANNRATSNRVLYGATTDAATGVELTTDGAAGSGTSNRIVVPTDTALSVVINISVKQTGSANAKQMLRQFVIVNNAGTTSIAGTVAILGTDSGSAGLTTVTTTITADDTNDTISVVVNGVAATNLRYTAYLVSTETLYT